MTAYLAVPRYRTWNVLLASYVSDKVRGGERLDMLDEPDWNDSDAEVEGDDDIVDGDGVLEELRTIHIDPLDRKQGVYDGDSPL